MAYNLSDRFSPTPKYFKFLDPCAYNLETKKTTQPSKYPFLSNTPRKTQCGNKIWTHSIYNADLQSKIINCTSLKSKQPRFPYEALSKEDIDQMLCRCGFELPCECSIEEEQDDSLCQGKVKKRLFKGPPPHSPIGGSLSVPSKGDRGFDILPDNSLKRLRIDVKDECPPFYNTRINEFTKFYHGCKWSKWTSQRSFKSIDVTPGPADYYFIKDPSQYEICIEKLRANRRKESRQLRYIEMIQNRNTLDNLPGPGLYNPRLPKQTALNCLIPKAKRFTESGCLIPGPAEYWLKREFDRPQFLKYKCHAKLPEVACFGNKAPRFKYRFVEGPSPDSYDTKYNPCKFVHCPKAPFGSSALRFKAKKILRKEENTNKVEFGIEATEKVDYKIKTQPQTWGFKSKTVRMKQLHKKYDEPSPADMPPKHIKVERSIQQQCTAPFFSSEGRFQPWFNHMPVCRMLKTPGPCYYNFEKPKCPPAYKYGPLYKMKRFKTNINQVPAPNEYKVSGGIESILKTHNERLSNNVKNKRIFKWNTPKDQRILTLEERELLLLNENIAILDTENTVEQQPSSLLNDKKEIAKLLRCFIYKKQIANEF